MLSLVVRRLEISIVYPGQLPDKTKRYLSETAKGRFYRRRGGTKRGYTRPAFNCCILMKRCHKRTRSQRTPSVKLPELRLEHLMKPKSIEMPDPDIKTTLRNSVKSISRLLDKLDQPELQFDFITFEEAHQGLKPNPDKVQRIDLDYKGGSYSNIRTIQQFDFPKRQQELDDLIWKAQDTLNDLVKESQNQNDCLVSIEKLFHLLEPYRKVEDEAQPPEATREVTKFEEKGIQVGSSGENVSYFRDMEYKFYTRMMESFNHMRFTAEVSSPFEISKPKASELVGTKHRILVEGSLREINEALKGVNFKLKTHSLLTRSPSYFSTPVTNRSLANSPTKCVLPPVTSSPSIYKKSSASRTSRRHSVEFSSVDTEAEVGINLKLDTLDAYKVTETRPMPQAFMQLTRIKYGEIEDLQFRMPELADCRFNLDDIFPRFAIHYEINVRSYFITDNEPSPAEYASLAKEVEQRLELYKILHQKRSDLRQVFLSYNLLKMSEVKDALSMTFTSFIQLLKDCMLIGDGMTDYEATKIFAISSICSKSLPELSAHTEKEWLNSFKKLNINNLYRLSLSGFIEGLVRVVHVHPRFNKFGLLTLTEKFLIFFERNLKPNALINNIFFFEPLLDDIHIVDLANHFQSKMSDVFSAYLTRLSERSQLMSMFEGGLKFELMSYFSMLDDLEVLEVNKNDEDEDGSKANKHSSVRAHVTSVKFASSLINKTKGRATLSKRERIQQDLVPITVPLREEMRVDKYIAFCFFISAMRRNYEIFLLDRNQLTEGDFTLNLLEFTDLMLLMAMYYWKTVDRTRSLAAAAYDYLSTTTSACLKARSASFIQRSNGAASDQLLSERAKQGAVLVSRTAFPQQSCSKRRFSV
mmetsp:Transcript_19640/g.36180  ORF Transcript_19640/g.36180 Transcript_19640/m.36180 type:complete len:869 (-) Transcript_19640:1777-4383(-)